MVTDSPTTEATNDTTAVERRRRAHRKVKSGCQACKSRRQKCDEKRPKCSACVRHSTHCHYAIFHPVTARTRRAAVASLPWQATAVDGTALYLPMPRSNPAISPSPDLPLEDLELLHQYVTCTCIATSQLPEVTVQYQLAVPQLAQRHAFVMRGLLAKAAVHLSWLRPARKAHYTYLAAKHHNAALPDFRSAVRNVSEDNHLALIMYAKGLVWCSFAWLETFDSQERKQPSSSPSGSASASASETDSSWLPNWFYLLRGSCLLVNACSRWIKSGLHILPQVEHVTEFSKHPDNRRLSALILQLPPLAGEESPVCETTLSSLKNAFALATLRHQNTPLRNAINYWVGEISNDFMQSVHQEEPWALVIMAHFSILVGRSETRWFMRGHAAQLLRSLLERLTDPWKPLVQWPCEEVGY